MRANTGPARAWRTSPSLFGYSLFGYSLFGYSLFGYSPLRRSSLRQRTDSLPSP
jgi:hypothetical protein